MADNNSSYRPHDPGYDYYAPGIYLITLVVRNRRHNARLFGTLSNDAHQPAMLLNDVGRAVLECWKSIPSRQTLHNRNVQVHTAVCMPDHFHGVIEVKERMDVSVGEVIRGFKAGTTKAWRECLRPSMAAGMEVQPHLVEQAEREQLKEKTVVYDV